MTEANIREDAAELPARVRLRRYIEALGGTLEITARFDKTTVVISNIGETP